MNKTPTGFEFIPLLRKSANAAFKGRSFGVFRLRLAVLAAGLRNKEQLLRIVRASPESTLRRFLEKRPEALGLLIWPYQSATWDARQRLERFQAHYEETDALGAPFASIPGQKVILEDMQNIFPGLKLVLDEPLWMMREGGLTINLFIDTFRAFSLTFSFFRTSDGQLEVMIGGCQGRDVDGILDTYRALTKAAHGLRPRDLLLECFGILCRALAVERVRAVSDSNRHRRHPFFKQAGAFKQSYDSIWIERGGELVEDGFYDLPLMPVRKDLSEIKAKKRAMYRKRFEFLDDFEQRLREGLKSAKVVEFRET